MTALQLILSNLPVLISSVNNFIDYIQQVRLVAQQTGEWSIAQEEEFQAMVNKAKTDPAWQSDPTPPIV